MRKPINKQHLVNNITFASDALRNVVEFAKNNGFQVYGFQYDKPISQVFIANEKGVCTVHVEWFGLLSIGSCHKPCREFGTGFGLLDRNDLRTEFTVAELNYAILIVKPQWAKEGEVKKYSNWEEYVKSDKILTYFEI